MLAALADHYVKRSIVVGLRRQGMDVAAALDRGWYQLDDESLLIAATAEGRILLTNDKGFLRRDVDWRKRGRVHGGIVYWPQQDRTIGDVIQSVYILACITHSDQIVGRVEYI